jgi:hypothetical protein
MRVCSVGLDWTGLDDFEMVKFAAFERRYINTKRHGRYDASDPRSSDYP